MKNKTMYIGIGVAVVGIAAYFLFFKKGKPTTNEQKGGDEVKDDAPVPPPPTGGGGSSRRMQYFTIANLRGQDRAVLKKGLNNPMDNKVLQSFLNNRSINAIKKGASTLLTGFAINVPEELKVDGIFGDKTEAALRFHTGKSEITIGELKQLIANATKDALKSGIGSLFIK